LINVLELSQSLMLVRRLSECGIGNKIAGAFAEALQGNTTLKELG
jgi:hypothetical protein